MSVPPRACSRELLDGDCGQRPERDTRDFRQRIIVRDGIGQARGDDTDPLEVGAQGEGTLRRRTDKVQVVDCEDDASSCPRRPHRVDEAVHWAGGPFAGHTQLMEQLSQCGRCRVGELGAPCHRHGGVDGCLARDLVEHGGLAGAVFALDDDRVARGE